MSGEKTTKYRECSVYWDKRLTSKHYATVVFHKGYTNAATSYKIASIGLPTDKNDLNLPEYWEFKLQNKRGKNKQ